jgi:NADH-quinone oxidoreductase subunit F
MNYEQILARAASQSTSPSDVSSITICVGSSPDNDMAEGVFRSFQIAVGEAALRATVRMTGSLGCYDLEPVVWIEQPGQPAILYNNATPEIAAQLVKDSLVNRNPRPDLAFCTLGDGRASGIPHFSDLSLFNLQRRIALRNCGTVDPEDINHSIWRGQGYSGLSRVLEMSPLAVIEEVKKSGLRGSGGTGHLAADKWKLCHDAEGSEKYLVCNAMSADSRALAARLLLESDPHSVLEGILIGAYAVGASHCILCVDAGCGPANRRLRKALGQMGEYGLLGNHILDSDFRAEIAVREVPALLVLAEETALLRFLEEKQPMPCLSPSYPSAIGFRGKPTLIDSVENFAKAAAIFEKGSEGHFRFGTVGDKATRIITLSGKAVHKYTVEVPIETTIETVVSCIGGGVPGGKKIKAVQVGGPTGAYFGADSLDRPLDDEALKETEDLIGSGTIEVFDSDSCAVEITTDIMSYLQAQSCGKCLFCREGTYQMSDILKDISEHKGKPEDLDLLIELGEEMKIGCLCVLGRTAPNPVLSSIELFRADYEAHVKDKRCGAGKS